MAFPALHHVGVVVRDMDEAARQNSERFGLPGINRRMTLHIEGGSYRGRRVTFSAEFGFVDLGGAILELIQPVGSDPSPYLDALNEAGEGTHHLAFIVPSIEQHLDTARAAGAPLSIVFDARLPGGRGRYVYAEGLVHGALIELIEYAAPPANIPNPTGQA